MSNKNDQPRNYCAPSVSVVDGSMFPRSTDEGPTQLFDTIVRHSDFNDLRHNQSYFDPDNHLLDGSQRAACKFCTFQPRFRDYPHPIASLGRFDADFS